MPFTPAHAMAMLPGVAWRRAPHLDPTCPAPGVLPAVVVTMTYLRRQWQAQLARFARCRPTVSDTHHGLPWTRAPEERCGIAARAPGAAKSSSSVITNI
jgi:hypothetical protein